MAQDLVRQRQVDVDAVNDADAARTAEDAGDVIVDGDDSGAPGPGGEDA